MLAASTCWCEVAAARDTTLRLITENRELWLRLEPEARKRAARMPFVIVEAQFQNETWWREAAEPQAPEGGALAPPSNGLPPDTSEHLMHETIMFAWQTARWDQTVAQLSFAMSPVVAEVIAALTPQQIRIIAARGNQGIRVRWDDDTWFWHDLLRSAEDGDEEKLAELQLHAKLLLCGELADPHSTAARGT